MVDSDLIIMLCIVVVIPVLSIVIFNYLSGYADRQHIRRISLIIRSALPEATFPNEKTGVFKGVMFGWSNSVNREKTGILGTVKSGWSNSINRGQQIPKDWLFKLSIPCNAAAEFEVNPKSKSIFGNLENLLTGDDEFDGLFRIGSLAPEYARDYFSSAEKRRAVKQLFDLNANMIALKQRRIVARWSYKLENESEAEFLKAAIPAAGLLAQNLPQDTNEITTSWKTQRWLAFTLVVLTFIGGVAAAVGAACLYPVFSAVYPSAPFQGAKFILCSLLFSVPALVVFLLWANGFLKGRFLSNSERINFFAWTILGFLLLGYGGFGLFNGVADSSPIFEQRYHVLHKQEYPGRGVTRYYLIVSWPDQSRPNEIFSVDRSIYVQAEPGKDQLAVSGKKGRLGFRWVVNKHLIKSTGLAAQ